MAPKENYPASRDQLAPNPQTAREDGSSRSQPVRRGRIFSPPLLGVDPEKVEQQVRDIKASRAAREAQHGPSRDTLTKVFVKDGVVFVCRNYYLNHRAEGGPEGEPAPPISL
jgi:hypothetical protein